MSEVLLYDSIKKIFLVNMWYAVHIIQFEKILTRLYLGKKTL